MLFADHKRCPPRCGCRYSETASSVLLVSCMDWTRDIIEGISPITRILLVLLHRYLFEFYIVCPVYLPLHAVEMVYIAGVSLIVKVIFQSICEIHRKCLH